MLYTIALVLMLNCIIKDTALVGINGGGRDINISYVLHMSARVSSWLVSSFVPHAGRWFGYSKFSLGVNMCLHGTLCAMDWHPNQGVFPRWIDFGSTMTLTRMNNK